MNTDEKEKWTTLNSIGDVARAIDDQLDAARYRWLRDGNNDAKGLFPQLSGDELDRGIDEAIGSAKQPAMKKVKSICWRGKAGGLCWTSSWYLPPDSGLWVRFPAGDISGEVEA